MYQCDGNICNMRSHFVAEQIHYTATGHILHIFWSCNKTRATVWKRKRRWKEKKNWRKKNRTKDKFYCDSCDSCSTLFLVRHFLFVSHSFLHYLSVLLLHLSACTTSKFSHFCFCSLCVCVFAKNGKLQVTPIQQWSIHAICVRMVMRNSIPNEKIYSKKMRQTRKIIFKEFFFPLPHQQADDSFESFVEHRSRWVIDKSKSKKQHRKIELIYTLWQQSIEFHTTSQWKKKWQNHNWRPMNTHRHKHTYEINNQFIG